MTDRTYGFYKNPEYIEKQRIKKVGKNNPKWKGGDSYTYQSNFYLKIAQSLKQVCMLCGKVNRLVIHHIDGNYKNNLLNNISIVCRGCHNKIHKTKIKGVKK